MSKLFADFREAYIRVRDGDYDALVKKIEEHISKKGTPCIWVSFKIIGGDFDGRIVPCNLHLTGRASGYFRKFVQAIKPDYLDGEVETDELIGKKVHLKISESPKVIGERSYSKIAIYPYVSPTTPEQIESTGGAQ